MSGEAAAPFMIAADLAQGRIAPGSVIMVGHVYRKD
jgi:hypothetical protein